MKKDRNYWDILSKYKAAKTKYNNIAQAIKDNELFSLGRYYSESGIRIDIPFVPSAKGKIETMMELAGNITGKQIADLGSGSGRILLALASRGAIADGYELEPYLIRQAINNLREAKLEATIYESNFFDANLSRYDGFMLYGISSMMGKLEAKLEREMKKGAFLVSNTFTFPNWPVMKEKDGVYLYIK